MDNKPTLSDLIEALPEDLRHLVVERASIIFDSGGDWADAEREAWLQESGRPLPSYLAAGGAPANANPGLARAAVREDEAAAAAVAPKSVRRRGA